MSKWLKLEGNRVKPNKTHKQSKLLYSVYSSVVLNIKATCTALNLLILSPAKWKILLIFQLLQHLYKLNSVHRMYQYNNNSLTSHRRSVAEANKPAKPPSNNNLSNYMLPISPNIVMNNFFRCRKCRIFWIEQLRLSQRHVWVFPTWAIGFTWRPWGQMLDWIFSESYIC